MHARALKGAVALDLIQQWELTLLKQAATQAPIEVIRPFRAIFGRPGELLGFNHALPVDPLDEHLPSAIRSLRARYQMRREPLRVEFVEEGWPGLAPALERAGLVVQSRNPLMACALDNFRPFAAAAVTVRFLEPDPRHPSTRRAAADLDGVAAGRASIGTVDRVAELYGVITEPAYRRRGVAASVCSSLLRGFFDEGGRLAFLDAESRAAERLYLRLGFRVIGTRLAYGEPDVPEG